MNHQAFIDNLADVRTPAIYYLSTLIPIVTVGIYQVFVSPFRFIASRSVLVFLVAAVPAGYLQKHYLYITVQEFLAGQCFFALPIALGMSWLISFLPVFKAEKDPIESRLENALEKRR